MNRSGPCAVVRALARFRSFAYSPLAALRHCKGACTAITMKRACAALSLDMTNPCGAHGYAVAPRISGAQNAAMKQCYAHGGKECVIRAWACDARG